MRKLLVTALAVGLVASVAAAPATAQKRKKKAKPVPVQLFLQGEATFGETEQVERWIDSAWWEMTPDEPEDGSKSVFVTNYVQGPNPNCSGNGLLPVWRGALSGRIKGDITATLHTTASPAASLVVELFPDATGGCNEDYIEPAGAVTVELPPGSNEVEAVIEDVDFEVVSSLVLQLRMEFQTPGQARVYFGGADTPSNLDFKCIPAKGKTC